MWHTNSLAETLAGHTPEQWAVDFLTAAGFPVTAANVQAVVSWEIAESEGGGGKYNPLNTTQTGYPGESPANWNGGNPVQNYAQYADGIAANAKVIHNGYYPNVVAAFRAGTDAQAVVNAIVSSPWGTRHINLVNVGPVAPGPAPTPTGGTEMQIVASPHKPVLTGRVTAALWDVSQPNQVLLTNGASIAGDVPVPAYGVRVWRPPVSPGQQGVGITASVGANGVPDGKGIVLQTNATATFIGLWS